MKITGSDVTELIPVNGVIHVAGIIRNPLQKIIISWIVDNSSGSTCCEAWRGQYEIDCLVKAGYKVLSIKLG